jgi:hypothetical protein
LICLGSSLICLGSSLICLGSSLMSLESSLMSHGSSLISLGSSLMSLGSSLMSLGSSLIRVGSCWQHLQSSCKVLQFRKTASIISRAICGNRLRTILRHSLFSLTGSIRVLQNADSKCLPYRKRPMTQRLRTFCDTNSLIFECGWPVRIDEIRRLTPISPAESTLPRTAFMLPDPIWGFASWPRIS